MRTIVNSKNEVVDILEDGTTFRGLNPDLTVYQCDAAGTEKALVELPEVKTDVTSKVAIKKGDEIEGVCMKEHLAQLMVLSAVK